MFIEPGKNNTSEDNDPFHVSGVETMIKYFEDENK